MNRNWKQWDFLLALPPLQKRHTGEALVDEVADILVYFGVEERYSKSSRVEMSVIRLDILSVSKMYLLNLHV
jgi:hypothetical protein